MVSTRSVFRGSFLVLLLIAISFFNIGGCSDSNNGGGDTTTRDPIHGVVIGDHPEEGLRDLRNALDIGEHTGEANHIHLYGPSLLDLTDEEIELIRQAFNEEYVISIYEVDAAVIAYLYGVILQIANVHEDTEDPENTDPEDTANTFTIEKHGNVIWTSKTHSGFTDLKETFGSLPGEDVSGDLNEFIHHSFHKRDWIESYDERRAELIQDGLIGGDTATMIKKFGLEDELEEINREAASTRDTTFIDDEGGTILNLATAHVQSNTSYIGFSDSEAIVGANSPSATDLNVYNIVNKVWVVTADTPDGLQSFVFMDQTLSLASANGYDETDEDPAPDGFPTRQAWYLREFVNTNTLKIGSRELDDDEAILLNSVPETNQATTAEVTSEVSRSVDGSIGIDTSGGSAGLSGGVSWSTSTTFNKENVSIDNLSLGQRPDLGNDSSFRYRPRPSEIFDDKCNNSMHNLADLSRSTFRPTQLSVWRIDGSDADKTLKIKTVISAVLRNSYIGNCNIFGCKCDVINQDANVSLSDKTFIHSIHIPAAP
ncbi:MAG: hypothetical protein WBA70_09140 [Thermodesulfobacteriota bacterium]